MLTIAFVGSRYSPVIDALAIRGGLQLMAIPSAPPNHGLRGAIRRLKGDIDASWAERRNIRYFDLSHDNQNELAQLIVDSGIDVLVSHNAPFLESAVLNAAKFESLNIHSSKLPAYRGGNPLLWQVVDGVSHSAISIHRMTEVFDFGDIISQSNFVISEHDSRSDLKQKAGIIASRAIVAVIKDLEQGAAISVTPQPEKSPTPPSNSRRRAAVNSIFQWDEASSALLYRFIRYLDFWPFEIAQPTGWRRLFAYRALKPLPMRTDRPVGLSPKGLNMVYQSTLGAVELAPKLSPIKIIRHLKDGRRRKSGKLQNDYL
jgi:methionyl-tRNA formyltransferase